MDTKNFADKSALRQAPDSTVVDQIRRANLADAWLVGFHEALQVLQPFRGSSSRSIVTAF